MATPTVFGQQFISQATPYWYERAVFTSTNTIAALGQASIVSGVSGWNGNFAKQVVVFDSIAATQDPNMLYTLKIDGQVRQVYGDTLKPNLRSSRLGVGLYKNIGITAYNVSTTTTVQNSQLLYGVSVWEAPIAYKVMRGFPLDPNELAIAKAVGIETTPVGQHGTLPIPLDAVIQRTYENRIQRVTLEYAGPDPTAAVTGSPFYSVSAQPNELLVLRSLGADIDADYQPTLTIGQDNNPQHLVIDPSLLSLDDPVDLFIPATQSLTFTLEVTTVPNGVVPFRFEVWHVALSSILNTRLGIATGQFGKESLIGLYGETKGADMYNRILAGVQ